MSKQSPLPEGLSLPKPLPIPHAPKQPRILVVGDIMLDVTRRGSVERIAAESPAMIINGDRTPEERLGGAAAVAAMCAALGARVSLWGVTGYDAAQRRVAELLREAGINAYYVTHDHDRPTTVKERVVGVSSGGQEQLLVRIDVESTAPFAGPQLALKIEQLLESVEAYNDAAASCSLRPEQAWDIIIVSDYGKGLVGPEVMDALRSLDIPIIVDPNKSGRWDHYHGVACLTPNRQEARGQDPSLLVKMYGLAFAVVKLDKDGVQFGFENRSGSIAALVKCPRNVCGAGDEFLASLGIAVAQGEEWGAAAALGHLAAALYCEAEAPRPVTKDELQHALATRRHPGIIHPADRREPH